MSYDLPENEKLLLKTNLAQLFRYSFHERIINKNGSAVEDFH